MAYKLDPDQDPLYQRLLPIYQGLDPNTKSKVYRSFALLWEGGANKDKPGFFTAGVAMKGAFIAHGIDPNPGMGGSAEYEDAIKAQELMEEISGD